MDGIRRIIAAVFAKKLSTIGYSSDSSDGNFNAEDTIEDPIYVPPSSGSDSEEKLTVSNNYLLPNSDNIKARDELLSSSVESAHGRSSSTPVVSESSDDDSDDIPLINLVRSTSEVHACDV
ncbi:hypothetical protein Trydic_g6178 [Trypoxylus dichotomus]